MLKFKRITINTFNISMQKILYFLNSQHRPLRKTSLEFLHLSLSFERARTLARSFSLSRSPEFREKAHFPGSADSLSQQPFPFSQRPISHRQGVVSPFVVVVVGICSERKKKERRKNGPPRSAPEENPWGKVVSLEGKSSTESREFLTRASFFSVVLSGK